MTTQFPELPEPWNNLAALYASRGELERAQDSLQMALRANPDYAAARANLGDIQLMMALRTYPRRRLAASRA
ncbi:Predicted O-linked N-acetylglucosamine transferase, SPINDLY family [Bordetella pertussis]|nr:Predicted O-linked N-acetylglucosamine transferase, SPINDLY family [Bordetella pertussis]